MERIARDINMGSGVKARSLFVIHHYRARYLMWSSFIFRKDRAQAVDVIFTQPEPRRLTWPYPSGITTINEEDSCVRDEEVAGSCS